MRKVDLTTLLLISTLPLYGYQSVQLSGVAFILGFIFLAALIMFAALGLTAVIFFVKKRGTTPKKERIKRKLGHFTATKSRYILPLYYLAVLLTFIFVKMNLSIWEVLLIAVGEGMLILTGTIPLARQGLQMYQNNRVINTFLDTK